MFHIIGTDDCIYCDKAKTFLEIMGKDYQFYNLKDYPFLLTLMNGFGMTTVPQVFKDKNYIGGYDSLKQYWNEDVAL